MKEFPSLLPLALKLAKASMSLDIPPVTPMRGAPNVQLVYPMGSIDMNQYILSRLISDVERIMCDIKKKHCQ